MTIPKLTIHGTSARLGSGYLRNSGQIVLGPNESPLTITGDSVIDGTGTISLGGSYNVYGYRDAPLRTITNTGNTFEGWGSIDFRSTHFINESHGLIEANLTNDRGQGIGLSTTIGGGIITDSKFTNRGTLRATNGSEINLFGFSEFSNHGGLIVADDSSFVVVNTATISGGQLKTNGSGVFQINTTGLRDIVLDADVQVMRNATLFGEIENRNTIRTREGLITSKENVVLTGGGKLVLNQARLWHDFSSSAETFTNVDNTIEVRLYGTINGMKFINQANGVVDSFGKPLA